MNHFEITIKNVYYITIPCIIFEHKSKKVKF